MFAMIIRDGEAADRYRMAGIVGAGQCRGASIESHRHRENLEDRAQLIDAEGIPIEHPVGEREGRMVRIGGGGVVRVEIRQRRHRENLAGIDVHNQPGAAFRGKVVDNALQFLAQDVLQAKIE